MINPEPRRCFKVTAIVRDDSLPVMAQRIAGGQARPERVLRGAAATGIAVDGIAPE
jgi:hypothetical protein